MHVALIGTRGVPAAYGGFETAAEEVGRRLAERGHRVTAYCRARTGATDHLGIERVELPALRSRSLETLSHTFLSSIHAATKLRPDVAIVFNSANSPWVPILRASGIPTALHMDGLEWKRAKWGRVGRRYYRFAEALGVRVADALISDAQGIADYYTSQYGADSHVITYGAPIISPPPDRLAELGLTPRHYTLIVARMEPENNVHIALEGAIAASSPDPIVVVGTVPYQSDYFDGIQRLAAGDRRVRMLGGLWDQDLLDTLYAHAKIYLHGHSVGGTNPSLLRAMGAATPVAAFDCVFNREVLGLHGLWWQTATDIVKLHNETPAQVLTALGKGSQSRAASVYRWEDVADDYEVLASKLRRCPP